MESGVREVSKKAVIMVKKTIRAQLVVGGPVVKVLVLLAVGLVVKTHPGVHQMSLMSL